LREKLDAFRRCLEHPLPSTELILDPREALVRQTYVFDPDHPQFRKALEELREKLP
jgi:hypothetical protein